MKIIQILPLLLKSLILSLILRSQKKIQYALLPLLEKHKKTIDKKGFVEGRGWGVLMDLSKTFDNLSHEFLIAKFHAYEFGKESLMLLLSYLSNR